jgi:hypothetical protein
MDVVPAMAQQAWEFAVESSGNEPRMTFRWDNSYFGSNDRELYWMDIATGIVLDMRSRNAYEFDPAVSRRFRVAYGDIGYVKENTRVTQLALHSVFPVPADEQVTVSFVLPGSVASQASVEITDLWGRTLGKWEREFQPGYNEVVWVRGQEAAGVYVVRVTWNEVTKQRRLVLR